MLICKNILKLLVDVSPKTVLATLKLPVLTKSIPKRYDGNWLITVSTGIQEYHFKIMSSNALQQTSLQKVDIVDGSGSGGSP